MATLKEYLEKVALRVGSRGAMPNGQEISILDSPKNGLGSNPIKYTAPFDGWLQILSAYGEQSGVAMAQNLSGHIYSTVEQTLISRVRAFVPAKKGDNLQIASANDTFKIERATFLKSVGGGLKSLIYKLFPEVRHAYA